jgi:nitroreductase
MRTSETFIRENYEQLSFSEAELRRKKVGLLGTMFPASWRTPGALDIAAAMAEPHGFLRDTLRGAPMLIVVTFDPRRRAPASEGDVLGMMSLGCLMENAWLAATALGIGFHVVSSVASVDVEGRIESMLSIPAGLRIAFAIRLGYPITGSSAALRVRRELSDFTHRNKYGRRSDP